MIKKVKNGDLAAMSVVVEEHQGAVHGFLSQLIGDREAALDVTQDVFVKAFLAIGGYSEQGTFKAWLFKIARNVGVDHLRRVGRRGGEHLELLDEVAPAQEIMIQQVENRELCGIAIELMARLPEVEREVMLLRVIEELKFKEIAEITGAPLNTVLGRMRNATTRMKQWMEQFQ